MRSLFLALVYLGLGERAEALDWLERAYEERDISMAWLNVDPTCDVVRSEPRFIALLEHVGLE